MYLLLALKGQHVQALPWHPWSIEIQMGIPIVQRHKFDVAFTVNQNKVNIEVFAKDSKFKATRAQLVCRHHVNIACDRKTIASSLSVEVMVAIVSKVP